MSVRPIYDKRKNIFCVIKDAYVGIVANMLILIYQRKVVGQLFNKLDEMIVLNIFSLHGSWSIGGEKSVGACIIIPPMNIQAISQSKGWYR